MNQHLYILDDDEQHSNLLTEVASSAGWQTSSGQSAVTFLATDLPDNSVLVLDLIMPDMDGIEVIRALADRKSTLLLILVSGFDTRVLHSAQQLAEAHNIKVIATLSKPISIKEFREILTQIKAGQPTFKKSAADKDPVLVKELDFAIQHQQLIIHYQPQINMKTGKVEGVESLVRWNHPKRGLLLPDLFISLAEDNNLIDLLTEEVISTTVKENRKWIEEGFNIPISINISAKNITSLILPEILKSLTDKYQVIAENLTLEITESAVMSELTSSLDVLSRLRMKGFSLSIDDFGTGYSSLSHLYRAPFTELKIDKFFVANMINDPEAHIIVKICIMLGQMLGMKIVAEGVETENVWDELKKLDCDVAQGYFIAKPMPANEFIEWKKNWDSKIPSNLSPVTQHTRL